MPQNLVLASKMQSGHTLLCLSSEGSSLLQMNWSCCFFIPVYMGSIDSNPYRANVSKVDKLHKQDSFVDNLLVVILGIWHLEVYKVKHQLQLCCMIHDKKSQRQ